MQISLLSELSGLSERNLRRGVAQVQQMGGKIHLQQNAISGADVRCFVATIYDLQTSFAQNSPTRPSIGEHFRWMKSQPRSRWIIPEDWPVDGQAQPEPEAAPSAAPAAVNKEELASLSNRLGQLEQKLDNLAARLESLEKTTLPAIERFTRAEGALHRIGLVLEDEEADNNLYNILVKHIGSLNERMAEMESATSELSTSLEKSLLKFASDYREVKGRITALLKQLEAR